MPRLAPASLVAQVMHPDGRITLHHPAAKTWNFRELQALVGGGHFQLVPIPGDDARIALCDEDGINKELPFNPGASLFLRQSVVGPVAVMLYDALRDENGE
jgi:hypothetical protein